MALTSYATRFARRRTLLPIGIIIAVWALFFWRVLTPVDADRLTFQQGDFTLQFLAYRQMAYRQLAEGHFPVFEECLYSGYPFQADPQSQVLYPPVAGTMALGRLLGWATYPLRALEWEVMLHVLVAALTMYAFLRDLRLHRLACLFGAFAFAFSGFMTGYAMLQTSILETSAWLPLIMLALRRLAVCQSARACARPVVLLAISVALAYTAGHPQTLLFIVYAGAAAYTFWAWRARRSARQVVLRGGAAAALAIGLSAAQLIPSLSFMLASTRAQLPFEEAGTGFVLHDISLFVLTGVTNIWQPLYVGMVTLVLAAVALSWRWAEVWLWVAIGAGALVLGFGANALGFDLAYMAAPGYKQFHSQERHALIVVFAMSTLGSYGLHALLGPLRRRARHRLWRACKHVAVGAVAAFALLVALLLFARLADPPRPEVGMFSDRVAMIALGLLATAGLLAWRARLGHTPRWLWGSAVLMLLLFDTFSVNRYTATQKPADPFPALPLVGPVQTAIDLPPALQTTGAYRLYNHYGLPLNGACVNGLNEISGGSPIVLRSYQTLLQRAPEDVYSRLLNVHYTITWRGGMGTDNGRRIPDRKLATDKYQNIEANTFLLDWPAPGPQPAWVVSNVLSVQDEDSLYQRLNDAHFDPLAEAVIDIRDRERAPGSASGKAGLEGKATGYMKIAAHADAQALLVVSEAYHWNWVARVNGAEVRPIIVDGALLGVPIPAGNSTIELSYIPTDLTIGTAISVAALLVIIGLLISSRSRGNGHAHEVSH
jgi:hypothetical protein